MTQIFICLRPLCSSHTACCHDFVICGSDINSICVDDHLYCHDKVYHVMSEHAHWVIAMQDQEQINNIYTLLPVSRVFGAHSGSPWIITHDTRGDTHVFVVVKKGAISGFHDHQINISQCSKMMKKTLQQGFTEKLPGTVRRVVS